MYHIATTFVPTVCLSSIAIVTLFIDTSHFEMSVTVSLTSMLVMYTLYQSVSASLPKTSYLKMIDIWILYGLVMPFIVFLVEVLLHPKDQGEEEKYGKENSSPKTTKFFEIRSSKSSTLRLQKKSKDGYMDRMKWYRRLAQTFIVFITFTFYMSYAIAVLLH